MHLRLPSCKRWKNFVHPYSKHAVSFSFSFPFSVSISVSVSVSQCPPQPQVPVSLQFPHRWRRRQRADHVHEVPRQDVIQWPAREELPRPWQPHAVHAARQVQPLRHQDVARHHQGGVRLVLSS